MNKKYIFSALAAGALLLGSCSDFDDVNVDPYAANASQVEVEYVLNSAITQSQYRPEFSGLMFNIIWKGNARQNFVANDRMQYTCPIGSYNDGWNSDSFKYLSDYMKASNLAVKLAEEKIAAGDAPDYVPNLLQVARIWRALQMADFTDSFGPMPVNGFQGVAPTYVGQKEVYNYVLSELKDASAKLDPSIVIKPGNEKYDMAYGFDFAKWQKFANSLRMRLAMRLSEVDAPYAKAEFEDAVKATGGYIVAAADQLKVAEYTAGWDDLSGVYYLTWITPLYSTTMNNIAVGLGGIPTTTSHPEFAAYVKPANYAGIKYENHFAMHTNDPMKGLWLDGMPAVMDPRIYTIYDAPGSTDNVFHNAAEPVNDFNLWIPGDTNHGAPQVVQKNVRYSWNGGPDGSLGELKSANDAYNTAKATKLYPAIARKYRGNAYGSHGEHMWFGEWESYFLIAEAAERGWTVPMSGKEAYETGIKANFEYFGLGTFSADYIASTSYNRVGTSVAWDHTTEAPEQTLNYVDGYTGATGTMTWKRPVNGLYTAANNDHLNKIITQKYIANDLYHPLEAWSDHRRLGLPFWENPVCEEPVQSMPELTVANSTGPAKVGFFVQRVRYPSGLQTSNPEGYGQAVGHLGTGGDNTLTPLWWAKK